MTDDQEYKSRSQKKRDSTSLQKAGQELAALTPGELDSLDLPEDLREAIEFWRKIRDHEGRRRQMQYIGRLMRELPDQERVLEKLRRLEDGKRDSVDRFRHIEALRDSLLSPDAGDRERHFKAALQDYSALEPGRLKHLVGNALAERENKKPPKSFRELFRYLKNAAGGDGPA